MEYNHGNETPEVNVSERIERQPATLFGRRIAETIGNISMTQFMQGNTDQRWDHAEYQVCQNGPIQTVPNGFQSIDGMTSLPNGYLLEKAENFRQQCLFAVSLLCRKQNNGHFFG